MYFVFYYLYIKDTVRLQICHNGALFDMPAKTMSQLFYQVIWCAA